jgi:polysaccharide pyruvyl transferase WcaK-like protein
MQTQKTTREAAQGMVAHCPRISLLTPYSGGNLGDAAIQDSMIANLRQRMPSAQFMGITLDGNNFLKQHGAGEFPLLAPAEPNASRSTDGRAEQEQPNQQGRSLSGANFPGRNAWSNRVKRMMRVVPGLVPLLKHVRARMTLILRELFHSYEGYCFLRTQDLLVISGGGQLDEEWGGAWQFPFALCKWAILARLAGVPCAMTSVGAGKITTRASRVFFSITLRGCCYRSYRETKTGVIAAGLLSRATNDPVVPDLAFSLPDSELPSPVGSIRTMARGRPVIALSPIAYAKPGVWPTPDRALHDRYLHQMAKVLTYLVQQGYFVMVVCSSLGDDESVIAEILGRLEDEVKQRIDEQIHFPKIKTWRDLAAVLPVADYLVASRLHGTILGFLTQTPVIAISFDPKVDWVMEDLHQTDYLLQIRDFTAEQVLNAVDRIKVCRQAVVEQIDSYRKDTLSLAACQYDTLARLALEHHQSHN